MTPLTISTSAVNCFIESCDEIQCYIGKTKRHLALWVDEHLSEKSAVHEYYGLFKDSLSCSINKCFILTQTKQILMP